MMKKSTRRTDTVIIPAVVVVISVWVCITGSFESLVLIWAWYLWYLWYSAIDNNDDDLYDEGWHND